MKFIDVSVPLDSALAVYPGNLPFQLEAVKRLADGASSNVSSLHLSAHAGTHVDAPRHFFDNGDGVDALPLELLIGRARVIELPSAKAIGPEELKAIEPQDVRVLLKTRNSRLWSSSEFHRDYVGLTADGATYLVNHGVKVLGLDYLSVEEFGKAGAPAHRTLLGGGTIIIEGLNLRDVEPGRYELYCLPLRVVGADGAPARVVLRQS
jgi:arylformamidase